MALPSDILTLGRRLHNGLRASIEDTDNYDSGKVRRQDYEQHACGMYLAGTLAFLEGKYGLRPWVNTETGTSLDKFLLGADDFTKKSLISTGICEAGLEALVCVRNALIHNDADLDKNKDKNALAKVVKAAIPGVAVVGTVVQLTSNHEVDFMEYVRKSFLAVALFRGGWR